jgi:4-aminobutyrate aminotransferase-like enzyme
VIEREDLVANAREVGRYLKDGLETLAQKYEVIGDVRGDGLFIGVELVRDRSTREPASGEAARLVNGMRRKHVLISAAGVHANTLKIRPPLPFSRDNADLLLATMDTVLANL